jgi:hypothetical protein
MSSPLPSSASESAAPTPSGGTAQRSKRSIAKVDYTSAYVTDPAKRGNCNSVLEDGLWAAGVCAGRSCFPVP